MRPIPPETISAALDILGTDGISEDEIEAQVAALVSDPMEARRLIDWIPEAFGMVLVSHLGKPALPTTFQARDARKQWHSFSLPSEPIYVATLAMAQSTYREGPRALFQNIALRSALASTVNNALNAGASIDGAVLSGPALVGIPAEIYLEQPSFWKRLFSW